MLHEGVGGELGDSAVLVGEELGDEGPLRVLSGDGRLLVLKTELVDEGVELRVAGSELDKGDCRSWLELVLLLLGTLELLLQVL